MPGIEFRGQDGAEVATLQEHADIDIGCAVELGELLLEAVPNHSLGLVLDLSTVDYVDSAGIRMLFGLARQLLMSRQGLSLCVPEASPLVRLVQITKLEEVAVVCSTVQEGLDELRSRS